MQLVRQRTANRLGLRNVLERLVAKRLSGKALKKVTNKDLSTWIDDATVRLSTEVSPALIDSLSEQIERLEKTILDHAVVEEGYQTLTTIPGVGPVLASTIEYETGEISRFPGARQYASYCRLVKAEKVSNQRIKDEGSRRNGNPYLSWAFHEAAHFAVRLQPEAKRWYERKRSKSCALIAIWAVAHKLARAVFYMIRDQAAYDAKRRFG